MRKIKRIIVHHTAGGIYETMKSIRHLHVNERGWSDIGYHYVIDRVGNLNLARPNWRIGAHCRGYNSTSIGVAVMGNFEQHRFDNSTGSLPEHVQVACLRALLAELTRRYPDAQIRKHSDYGNTLCPGKYLAAWLDDNIFILTDEGGK